jgi:predicted signal transduction protein with EAL and GGDEF domain
MLACGRLEATAEPLRGKTDHKPILILHGFCGPGVLYRPLDVAKFNITLTRRIDASNRSPIRTHLARMILEYGHLLMAEGIESESAAKQLARLGFRYDQGYYFRQAVDEARPVGKAH